MRLRANGWSEEERRVYDDYLAYLGQELGIIDTAKEEGREEGEPKGKLKVARNALNKGFSFRRHC